MLGNIFINTEDLDNFRGLLFCLPHMTLGDWVITDSVKGQMAVGLLNAPQYIAIKEDVNSSESCPALYIL